MSLREDIDRVFEGKAWLRPLFYGYEGGLRFELAQSGSSIHQFRTALNRSTEVCEQVFESSPQLLVCLRLRTLGSVYAARGILRGLRELNINVPPQRELWAEPLHPDDWLDDHTPQYWMTLAFPTSSTSLEPLLWSACATDFNIRPKLPCQVYLLDLERGVMACPYDDRGMDLVGPNHELLSGLFHRFRHYLLSYDMETMLITFGHTEPKNS